VGFWPKAVTPEEYVAEPCQPDTSGRAVSSPLTLQARAREPRGRVCARAPHGTARITRVSRELITTTEAADIIGIEPSSVRKLISAGSLPTVRRVGQIYLLDRDVVQEFATTRHRRTARRRGEGPSIPTVAWDVLHLLAQVEAFTAAELALALDRHQGNVRKYLAIWRHRGYVATLPTDPVSYRLTEAGHTYLHELTAQAS
jgi:excisionase family DNA binding protein